jgi:hypothetical protein
MYINMVHYTACLSKKLQGGSIKCYKLFIYHLYILLYRHGH